MVVLGGGNGAALTLSALKKFSEQLEISAVITTADSGASSGQLRREVGMLPPGDLLRAILALSPYDYAVLKKVFYSNRFSFGRLVNINLGNLFLAALHGQSNDIRQAIESLSKAVEAVGKVFPVTLEPTSLNVQLSDGQEIISEANIDRPEHDRSLKIIYAWLDEAVANPEALAAIRQADYIIIGPGSLYTSLVATLLPKGIKEEINNSAAKLWYVVARAFEANGETGPEKLSEAILTLERYLPRPFDGVVYNNHTLDDAEQAAYADRQWQPYELDAGAIQGKRVLGHDFEKTEGVGYSAEKLAVIFRQIFRLQ